MPSPPGREPARLPGLPAPLSGARSHPAPRPLTPAWTLLLVAFIAAACSGVAVPSGGRNASATSAIAATQGAQPTPVPPDQGWVVRLQGIEESAGQPGYQDLDASVWLVWQGPGPTHVPGIAASVESGPAANFPVEPTVLADGDEVVPVGFAVPAEIAGQWPVTLPSPVLHIYATPTTPLHDGRFELDQAVTPEALPPMPPATGSGTLDVPGVVRVTPSSLTVYHSLDGLTTVAARHGSHVLQYGGGGDLWQVAMGATVQNLGTTDLPVDSLLFELFDSAWAEDAPNVVVDPADDPDSVPAGQSIAISLVFDLEDEPTDLRLFAAWQDKDAPPTSGSITAFGAPEIAAGKQAFRAVLAAVDTWQEACRTGHASNPTAIGTSDVEYAAVTTATDAIVRTNDAYLDHHGAEAGTSENTYVLERGPKGWSVTSMEAGSPDQVPAC